jgi:hypothetical protein
VRQIHKLQRRFEAISSVVAASGLAVSVGYVHAYLNFQTPNSGISDTAASMDSATDAATACALTSRLRGITATMRGAPLTPTNMRVAENKACLFLIWICLALFRLFSLDRAAAAEGNVFWD